VNVEPRVPSTFFAAVPTCRNFSKGVFAFDRAPDERALLGRQATTLPVSTRCKTNDAYIAAMGIRMSFE
jgi:hypothetical protein